MFPISILKALKKEKTGLNRAYTCIYTEKFEKQWETKFGNNSERGTAVTDAISLVTPTRYRLITIRTIGNSTVITKIFLPQQKSAAVTGVTDSLIKGCEQRKIRTYGHLYAHIRRKRLKRHQ